MLTERFKETEMQTIPEEPPRNLLSQRCLLHPSRPRQPLSQPRPNSNPLSKSPVPVSWKQKQEVYVNSFFRITITGMLLSWGLSS
ncbi:hypothetical protein BDW66DRAFT_123675 [Aspergillus desertorum]